MSNYGAIIICTGSACIRYHENWLCRANNQHGICRSFPQLARLRTHSLTRQVKHGFSQVKGDTVSDVSSNDFFRGKVVLIGLPAAFSPTCSEKHVPGYLAHARDFKQKGVDKIAVLAVNDFFTMKAWAKAQDIGDEISFVADGNGELTNALGLELDLTKAVLGKRCKRFSMVLEDGIVKSLSVEPDGTGYTVSSAESTLKQV